MIKLCDANLGTRFQEKFSTTITTNITFITYILTTSVLTCAKEGTLKIPWISSGAALTPNHKNICSPFANRNNPPSDRRSSEQRTAAGRTSLLTSRVCWKDESQVLYFSTTCEKPCNPSHNYSDARQPHCV